MRQKAHHFSLDQQLTPSLRTRSLLSNLMMGNNKTNEKGKAPVSADSATSRGISPPSSLTILDGNVDEDAFDSLLSLTYADLEDFHRSLSQELPETVANPSGYSTNSNSFQNPQINMSSNTVNTNVQRVSSLPDWNMSWGQQSVNQPVHTRNNAGFSQSQSGLQGNFGDNGFLSLRLGGTEESVSRSQAGSRDSSDKLKETASNELNMAWAWGQTLDAGFMGFHSNNNGLSNQFCRENRMNSTNNEVGFLGSLKEAVSTELKMVHGRQATGQSSGQSSNAGFMGFYSNSTGSSDRFSNMDGMNLTNNIIQIQQNDSRNIRSGDLNQYRAFIGNQPVHSGTIGGHSAQIINSQQHNLNKPSEFEKPSRSISYARSIIANNPSYAGQVISQNATPSQVVGVGSNMFSHRTAGTQVSWGESGPAGIDVPFPKRLGVEFNVRNSLQSNQRHLSHMGTSIQTTSTGQACQFPDKGLTRLTDHVLRPSVGRTDGAPVRYPINSQQPFLAHGQSHNAPIQLAKDPQGVPSANASTVIGQSQKPDLHNRPHHKRSAVVPHPDSRWVQRQKMNHPTIHHSNTLKSSIPVTTTQVHPSIPGGPRTQPAGPVAARTLPVIPIVRPRVPVTSTAPAAISRITSKDPESTPKLSGYKCYLCKRDLALTSEGAVYQPAAPPPVAILPCGHSFHDQCLQNITPDDQAKDPPCIPCAIGEQ
ncbi:putative transcription factor C2H2 family [Helianthus debilis subsp. tardiflorus]